MGVAGSNRHNRRSRPSAAAASTSPTPPAAAPSTSSSSESASTRNGSANGRATRAKSLTFTIPSTTLAVREVHKQIMDCVEACHYDEQATFAIRLALEEGLMNAINHGNKLDPKKSVSVEAKVGPKSTEICIEDQGQGFARSHVPDPCAEENLLKCSGRGILLMEAYMDKVDYSRGGRRVRMIKKNA